MLRPNSDWSIAENGILERFIPDDSGKDLKEIEFELKMKMFKNTILQSRVFSGVSGSKMKASSYSTMIAYNLAKADKIRFSEIIIDFMESKEVDQDNLIDYVSEKTKDWVKENSKTGNVLNDVLNYYYHDLKARRTVRVQCQDSILLVDLLMYLKEQGVSNFDLKEILYGILDNSVLQANDIVMTSINLLLNPKAELAFENQKYLIDAMREQLASSVISKIVNWEYLEALPVVDLKPLGLSIDEEDDNSSDEISWGDSKPKCLREQVNKLELRYTLSLLEVLYTGDNNIIKGDKTELAEDVFSISNSFYDDALLDTSAPPIPMKHGICDRLMFLKTSLKRLNKTWKHGKFNLNLKQL